MLRKVLVVMTLAAAGLCYSASAKADNLHLCDINQTTSCNGGSVIPVFSGQTNAWVFGKQASGDTLYIAVLTPGGGSSQTFTGPSGTNTNLGTALGFGPQNFPNFSSTHDQVLQATGISAGSFNVTVLPGVTWTGSVNNGQLVTLPGGVPVGTVFIAYLVDSTGNLVAVSPWSSGLIYLPEPSSIVLLGVGMLGLGAVASRRLLAN